MERTGDIKLGAAREQTDTLRAAEGVAKEAVQKTIVDAGGVADAGDVVAAGQGGLLTTLVLGLAQSVLVGVVEDGVNIGSLAASGGGKSQSGGGEERDNGEELHFDGWYGWRFVLEKAWRR